MKKSRRAMITIIIFLILTNISYAGFLSPKAENDLANIFGSSFFGGIIIGGTTGAGAIGLALANSALVVGITLGVNSLSSSTETQINQKIVQEIIKKEGADFQFNGEMGMVLGAGVKTLQDEFPELSESEAVDLLLLSVN